MVHADLSTPSNVLVRDGAVVAVVDIGNAGSGTRATDLTTLVWYTFQDPLLDGVRGRLWKRILDLVGWRASFAAVAVLATVLAVLVTTVVAAAAPAAAGRVDQHRRTRRLRPMLLTTGLVGLLLVGHYGAFTFITRLAEAPALLVPGQVSGLLLVFGLASAVGVLLAGRAGCRRPSRLR